MIKIEKNIEHEREKKSVEIEENILTESVALCIDKRCIYFLMPMPNEEHLVVFSRMGFHVTCCVYV